MNILALVHFLAAFAAAQDRGTLASFSPPADRRMVVAATRAAEAPTIDGLDDDAVWREAERRSDFQQFDPDDQAAPSLPTEFQVAYDDRNLYVYVRAHDPHPDSIVRALSRRDVRAASDQISVAVDSYFDRRTGYQFGVNVDGVKIDQAIYGDDGRDATWNAVWEAETRVDSLGWAAEFRIPLSQLRYPDSPSHTFGIGVFRDITRYLEMDSWPAMSRNEAGYISKLATLEGLSGLSGSRTIEVTPYTVARAERRPASAGYESTGALSVGADVKLRVTPNLTLDATVNPDFGQVEADPADLNLTAFETFFSERRPFFVEGTGLYRFALNCYVVVDCNTNEGLFYSRRIGRTPYLIDDHGDRSTPRSTPIAAATKVTGRTSGGLSFGVLDAVTRRVDGVDGATVEPGTNFAALSAEQDFRSGEAGVRLIATGVNRSVDAWTDPYLHTAAYAAGLSGRSRFLAGNFEASASLAVSRVEGSPEAIARTQRSAVHYFQQPGDDPELDPTRTSLSGTSGQLKVGKYGGGITRFETSFVRHSAGFEVNDLGYLRRADTQDWSSWGALRFNTPTGAYRWLQVNGNHWQTWTTSGMRLDGAFNFNAHMGLHNNWDVHAGATFGSLWGSFCDRCTRGGPALLKSRGYYPWFGINTDSRRAIAPSMWVNLGFTEEGRSSNVRLGPQVAFRFSTAMQARVGSNLVWNADNSQWVGNYTDADGTTHHAFARLDQRTISMNVRLNYTATPDLTFEFYGEPFVSTGRYEDFREVSATPAAERYLDRFEPYAPPPSQASGFTFRQLETNAVVRWEYLPGSTLFLVWAHGRRGSADGSTGRPWVDEYRDLLRIRPEHTFLIKVAHWFSR